MKIFLSFLAIFFMLGVLEEKDKDKKSINAICFVITLVCLTLINLPLIAS